MLESNTRSVLESEPFTTERAGTVSVNKLSVSNIGIKAEIYLTALRQKGRKESTINCYRSGLRQCFICLEADHRSISPDDICVDDVHYLWRSLGVKEEVRHGYLRNLSGYVMYYTGRDVVKQADILMNREMRNRIFIDRREFALLMNAANPFQRIILILGGMMGLRRVEMLGITEEDIHEGYLVVHGKGHGESGLVVNAYLPAIVRDEIDRYRRWKHVFLPRSSDGYLLQTRSRGGISSRATPQQVSMAVRGLGIACGIEVTTHSLRRLYATTLYNEVSADIQTVKTLMRHSSIDTTLKCYIMADDEKKKAAARDVTRLLLEGVHLRGRGARSVAVTGEDGTTGSRSELIRNDSRTVPSFRVFPTVRSPPVSHLGGRRISRTPASETPRSRTISVDGRLAFRPRSLRPVSGPSIWAPVRGQDRMRHLPTALLK